MLIDLHVGGQASKITEEDRFRYYQLGHWTTNRIIKEASTRPLTPFKMLTTILQGKRGMGSKIYKVMATPLTHFRWN